MKNNTLKNSTLFKTGKLVLAKPSGSEWSFSAIGDMRPVKKLNEIFDENYPLQEIQKVLKADLVLGNLEIPVIENKKILNKYKAPEAGPDKPSSQIFIKHHISEKQLLLFNKYGVNLFNVANNHIKDFGEAGVLETLKYLKKNKFSYLGAGKNKAQAGKIKVIINNGIRIGFWSMAQDEDIAAGENAGASVISQKNAFRAIREMKKKKCDIKIISFHDGYEFSDVPRIEMYKLCHEIAEQGVDLILGHHPHVPHGIEKYKDTFIFYSLGNFLFKMDRHGREDWTDRSFFPRFSFSGKKLSKIELFPIYLDKDMLLKIARGKQKNEILNHLKKLSTYLNPRDIDEQNRKFTVDVMAVVAGVLYEAGTNHNEKFLNFFLEKQMYKDPYLKIFKDSARLFRKHEDFSKF